MRVVTADRFELVQNADDNCYQVDEPELCLSLHQTGAEQCCVGKSQQERARDFKIFQGFLDHLADFGREMEAQILRIFLFHLFAVHWSCICL